MIAVSTTRQTAGNDPTSIPLRLWPGVVLVLLQWLLRFALPAFSAELAPVGFIGALAGGVLIVVWWLAFSRAPHADRWIAFAVLVAALLATPRLVLHPSLATGMMGFGFYFFGVPTVCLGLVVGVAATRRLDAAPRRVLTAVLIVLGATGWGLVRSEGLDGAATSELSWRWQPTAEERLLAAAEGVQQMTTSASPSTVPEAAWSGFRGPQRDGVVYGSAIPTDWEAAPPDELWRRAIGPGWSSFAVAGDFVYTQEQRGEDEVVAAYSLSRGEPLWMHRDATRFWESNAGAGPRATPTLHGDRVYSLGATGILNALDAATGELLWTRDAAGDVGEELGAPGGSVEVPMWGFSGSPLLLDAEGADEALVAVALGGTLAAYGADDGDLRWVGPDGGVESYSSPHRAVLDGVEQILLLGVEALVSVDRDGEVLWRHAWGGAPIVQPLPLGDADLLLAVHANSGLRRLSVRGAVGTWQVDERWTSNGLKPYFNDFVVHEGHAYGFDGRILAGIDLDTGKRVWKGGRYGNGQLLLLADQDLLLVLAESGELALVAAHPDGFQELARHPALEGKTWNHPVLVGDTLLVRNDQDMAAFRLAGTEG